MSEYPEHDKLRALEGRNQTVGEFIEWLGESGYVIARRGGPFGTLHQVNVSVNDLLARFFGIDTDAIEREKREMLEQIQRRSASND
jgi:hypothetical protein